MRFLELFLPFVKSDELLMKKHPPKGILLERAMAARQSPPFIERLLRAYKSLPDDSPVVAIAIDYDYGDEIVRQLLEKKANPNAWYKKAVRWMLPIVLAEEKKRTATVELLRKYGATHDENKEAEGAARQKSDSENRLRLLRSLTLVSADDKEVQAENILKGKKRIGLFFSIVNVNDWVEVEALNRFYASCQEKGRSMELILLRYDMSFIKVLEYMRSNKITWHSVPDDRYESYRQLFKSCKVREQPSLVILDEEGNILSSNGIWDIRIYGDKAYELWGAPGYKPATKKDSLNMNK